MTDKKATSKKWVIGFATAALVFLGLILGKSLLPKPPEVIGGNGEMVLYYTVTCPHCKNVEEFIDENEVSGVTKKEISMSQVAADELYDRLVGCGEDVSQGLPVPVLWESGKCFVGEDEAINYLKGLTSEK
ncbi:MAG: glutaredoxin domain-containing protein [Parcubacteria group bacterium]